jgi:hypothetical protein
METFLRNDRYSKKMNNHICLSLKKLSQRLHKRVLN